MDFSPVEQFELEVPSGAQAPDEALLTTVQHLVEAPESLHTLGALAPSSHAAFFQAEEPLSVSFIDRLHIYYMQLLLKIFFNQSCYRICREKARHRLPYSAAPGIPGAVLSAPP